LSEMIRVTRPGGHVAVANWADARHNDLNVIEEAVARADGEEPPPDGELRFAGALEELLREAGLTVVAGGRVELPWTAADDDTLIRGILLGESSETIADLTAVVQEAARPFRTDTGGYRLVNSFRFAVGRHSG
jgi:hypothetical protein